MNRTMISSFGALALLVAAGQAHADVTETKVIGVAAITNNDKAMARDRALDDAKRKAVEQVAGTQVSAESISENFQLVSDRIYSRASGFVKSYQVLTEHEEEGVYKVEISAQVDSSAIADDLALIFKTKPRVIVMVAEQNIGSKGFSYWWGSSGYVADLQLTQNTLIESWQPKGFKFVDAALLAGKLKKKAAMNKPDVSDDNAVTIGQDADADVAIVGRVLVSDAGPVMDGLKMHSFQAVGTMRVLNIDTGEIIAVSDERAAATHVDANVGGRNAIKKLAGKLAAKLEAKILTKWTAEAASSREIELAVTGVKRTKQAKAIVKAIQGKVRGVESVAQRRLRKGKAKFTVKVRARASDLAEDLENLSLDGFKLEVETVTRARIVARVTK